MNLHGFDEGLVQKLNYGVLQLAMSEARTTRRQKPTKVSTTIDKFMFSNIKWSIDVTRCHAM